MATNIDPDLLRRILMGETVDGYGMGRGNYVGPRPTEADDGTVDMRNYEDVIYRNVNDPSWGQSVWDTYNLDGTYRGRGSGDSDNLGLAKFVLASLAAYGGANALNGMGGAAGATGAEGLTAADLATSAWGELGGMGGAAGATGAAGGTAASTLGTAGSTASTLGSMLGDGSTLAGIAGAVAGAADSGDKQNTTSKDPWAPAQPYLKGLLTEGANLYSNLKDQPFSQAQRSAYANVGGLLDSINQGAGGLMSGMAANASGANQFRRGGGGLLSGGSAGYTFSPYGYGGFGI